MSFDLFSALCRQDTMTAVKCIRGGGSIIKSHQDGEISYRANGEKTIHEDAIRALTDCGLITGEAALIDNNPQRFVAGLNSDFGLVIARKCFGNYIAARSNSPEAKEAQSKGVRVVRKADEARLISTLAALGVPWSIQDERAA